MYVYIWYLKFKRKRGSCASPIMTALLWKGLLPIRDSGCKLCKNPNNSWRWLAHLNQTGNKKIWTFDQSISLKMLYFNSLMVGFLWIFFSDQTESFYKCSDAKSPVKSSINAPLPSLFMQELTHLWWQTLIRLKSCAITVTPPADHLLIGVHFLCWPFPSYEQPSMDDEVRGGETDNIVSGHVTNTCGF